MQADFEDLSDDLVSASSWHLIKFSIVEAYKPFLLYTNYYHHLLGQVGFLLTLKTGYHMHSGPQGPRAEDMRDRMRADERSVGYLI